MGHIISKTHVLFFLFRGRQSHTNCGDGSDDLPQLQLVQDGGFPCSVQPHHENPHLLLAYQALQQVPKDVSHDASGGEEVGAQLQQNCYTGCLLLYIATSRQNKP